MRSRVICIGSQTKRSVPEPTVADREGLGAGGGSRLRGGQHGQGLMFLEEGWSGGGWEGRAFSKVVHLCTCVRLCTHVCVFVYTRECVCVCVCVLVWGALMFFLNVPHGNPLHAYILSLAHK